VDYESPTGIPDVLKGYVFFLGGRVSTRWLGVQVGHAGTLDPMATGLLVICTGRATKLIHTFTGMHKEYTGVPAGGHLCQCHVVLNSTKGLFVEFLHCVSHLCNAVDWCCRWLLSYDCAGVLPLGSACQPGKRCAAS
jgi:hypothetical protein